MEARSKANLELLKARDPCYDESVLSLKCLEAGDKESCEKEINNYKRCKTFWYDIYNFRKFHGIKPFQPEPNDRKTIKESFLKSRNFKQVCDEILREELKRKSQ